MKTYALMTAGRVVEIFPPVLDALGNEIPIQERFHPDFVSTLVEYDPENPPAEPPEPEPVVVVPAAVTMRQARLALLGAGKLQAVSDAIAALPSPQKEAAQIEWEFAASVERASPFLASLASQIHLADSELDALFIAAAQL